MGTQIEKENGRTKKVSFRCTEEEWANIMLAYKKSKHRSLSAYLRDSARYPYLLVVDPILYKAAIEATEKWAVEVNRVGNNINQIVRVINERRIPKKEWLTAVGNDLHALREAIEASDVMLWKSISGRR